MCTRVALLKHKIQIYSTVTPVFILFTSLIELNKQEASKRIAAGVSLCEMANSWLMKKSFSEVFPICMLLAVEEHQNITRRV